LTNAARRAVGSRQRRSRAASHLPGDDGAIPVPADVTTSSGSLGGVPVVNVEAAGADPEWVIFYLHGGAYAIGTAASSVRLASDLARRTGAQLVTVDYRLAPEHPQPAAIEDAVSAYRGLLDSGVAASAVAVAGESAGAGLAAATLVALKHVGLPEPSAAVLMSPWVDLTLSGASISSKAALDPVLTSAGLARRAANYLADGDAAGELASPIFADLTGLPPLLIQAGSHEILLNDATRLAAHAAAADVAITLEITPGVAHVFQGFAAMLDEGKAPVVSPFGAFDGPGPVRHRRAPSARLGFTRQRHESAGASAGPRGRRPRFCPVPAAGRSGSRGFAAAAATKISSSLVGRVRKVLASLQRLDDAVQLRDHDRHGYRRPSSCCGRRAVRRVGPRARR